MAADASKGRWGPVLRYTFAAALLLLMPVAMRAGLQWYWSVVNLCTALTIVYGHRRIFRPGVSRTADEVICRYVPWFEGNAYMAIAIIPLMGAAMTAAGWEPSNAAWLRFAGILLLGVMPLILWGVVQLWRRSLLRFSPTTLTIRSATPGSKLMEIRREHIESITPKMLRNPVNGHSLQTEIVYHTTDSSNTDTVVLGLHLTVRPRNLADALLTWKYATDDDPTALLDRIENILRGHSSPT